MDIAVSGTVVKRNGIGRFIQECEDAARGTIAKAISEGEKLSKEMAPEGTKIDHRTVTLKAGMFKEQMSRTSGRWGCAARHALPIEKGAVPHGIPGNVKFFWDDQGRWWIPGENMINHPGNAAQPYLRPAYEVIMAKVMEIARQEYPG